MRYLRQSWPEMVCRDAQGLVIPYGDAAFPRDKQPADFDDTANPVVNPAVITPSPPGPGRALGGRSA